MTTAVVLSIIGCVGMAAVGVSQVYKGISGVAEEIKKAKVETSDETVEKKEA